MTREATEAPIAHGIAREPSDRGRSSGRLGWRGTATCLVSARGPPGEARAEHPVAAARSVAIMNKGITRTTVITVGVIAIAVGVIWVGQGMGLIPGSFMTGDTKWLIIGIIVGVVGIAVTVFGLRRPKGSRSGS